MRIAVKIGVVFVLLVMLGCKQTGEKDGQGAPSPGSSAAGSAQGTEVRVPRETATKLLDLSASPSPQDPGSAERNQGESAVLERGPQGTAVSMRLFGVRPDSLLGKAGFQNGDRVLDINGVAPGEPKERWDNIRQLNRFDVHLTRRGATMTTTLIVE